MVTGAAGFIGSRVVQRLLMDGVPVTAVVRSTEPAKLARLHGAMRRRYGDSLHLVACDLHDRAASAALIAAHRPALCVHAAWDVTPHRYRDDLANAQWITTSLNFMESLLDHGCHWVGVFGTCIEPTQGELASCCYAAAKAVLREQMNQRLLNQAQSPRLRLCWWKVFQPYGPGEPAQRLVPSLIDALLHGREFPIHAPDEQRDFIHVDDVAAAVCASMAHRVCGTFDLGTGRAHRIAELAEIVAELVDAQHDLPAGERLSHPPAGATPALVADTQALFAVTGWRAGIDLHTGLTRLIDRARRRIGAIA